MSYTIRLATCRDANQMAVTHLECLRSLPTSLMAALGRSFLKQYYWIATRESRSLILCIQDEAGRVGGLAIGSLDAAEHAAMLRKHRLRLLLGALPAILTKPKLLRALVDRNKAQRQKGEEDGYIVTKGPRLEFWGCLTSFRPGASALRLLETWLAVGRALGADSVRFEVNATEEHIEALHRSLGATIVKEWQTPDGRRRKVGEYRLGS